MIILISLLYLKFIIKCISITKIYQSVIKETPLDLKRTRSQEQTSESVLCIIKEAYMRDILPAHLICSTLTLKDEPYAGQYSSFRRSPPCRSCTSLEGDCLQEKSTCCDSCDCCQVGYEGLSQW